MKNKVGLIAGTFDPPTLGHVDLIKRAAEICHVLYVGIAVNSKKRKPYFTTLERQAMLSEVCQKIPNIKIVEIPGLVAEFAHLHKIDFLIRGLRSTSDFDSELQLACANRKLCGIETVFLIANPNFSHISSTLINEIACGRYRVHEFVPEELEDAVYTRLTLKDNNPM